MIGGFFFLRFINPAIVTPQAYMLVDGVPAKFPRRTLTLVRNFTPHSLTAWCNRVRIDREDAAESGEQAFICEGGIYDHLEPLR